ncbi:hypothetical protein CEQ90_13425 [Lewinellaceae bacterium SD302]|nr:hypothetical protein CEQ90_13425 [Lewinellaceae bacterium SD302]
MSYRPRAIFFLLSFCFATLPAVIVAGSSELLATQTNSPLAWVKDHPATIVYTLDLTNVQQHELNITVDFPAVTTGAFRLKMPTASPGRYAEHNFAKNVYMVQAFNGKGERIDVSRDGINDWIVSGHDGSVRVTYKLFANGGDGTYSGIDNRKLHLNMPATFLFGDKLNDRPVKIVIPKDQRPEWTVASQLEDLGDRQYAAPNYYYFYDSPTMVGEIDVHSFKNGDQTIEVAYMTEDSDEDKAAYTAWVEKIVESQRRVYGELPRYDYGRYTFLCSYNPYIGGDGMEHRNSTICSASVGLEKYADRLIGTVSHEFFHCWNVERIRPASLEPFDFSHANQSGELWFAEGFTSYYDDLTLVRSGIISDTAYVEGLGGMLNYVYNRPGRKYRNPIMMSQQAPFVDAATANDEDNFANTFVSYYPYGAVLGLTLDIQLRQQGHDLDELMRLVWQRHGKPEIPYHINDLETALGDLIEDSEWAAEWFQRHVYGSELMPLDELFEPMNVEVSFERPDTVTFPNLRLRAEDTETGGVKVTNKVAELDALYAAGVDRNSIITELNGQKIATRDDWDAAVAELEVGKTYSIGFTQLGQEQRGEFEAKESPNFRLKIGKKSKLRNKWLMR